MPDPQVFTEEHIAAAQEAFDPSNRRDYPDMPTSEAEWRCHCAFWRLSIDQRDRAWQNEAALKEDVAEMRRELEEKDSEMALLRNELDDARDAL